MELTRKYLENLADGKGYSIHTTFFDTVQEMAKQLLAEMDKPKIPEIDWESRPWATEVRIAYCTKDCPPDHIGDRIATIKRPKTRIDEIAEDCWHEINKGVTGLPVEVIKRAILKARKELEAEK